MKPQIILINGPSSSGKSTLAKALQQTVLTERGERYEVVSIDDFLPMSPEETIYEDDVYRISGDLCRKAREVLEAGTGVIVDHVITSERIFRQLTEGLAPYDLRTVRVTCPLPLLRERELARGDRSPGSAEASEEYLYPKTGYDLAVDTGAAAPEENARRIFDRFFGPAEV